MGMARIFPTKNPKRSSFVVITYFSKMFALIGKGYKPIVIKETLESHFER